MRELVHTVMHYFTDVETGDVVRFEEWYSEYMEEDFVGVTAYDKRGVEIFHAGMTHLEISEAAASDVLDSVYPIKKMAGE